MAKQDGILPVKGTLGNLTFYKRADGQHYVRLKGGVSSEQLKKDPKFQRTRENGAEFGRANKAGRTLRHAVRSSIIRIADSGMTPRLTQAMMKVLQADLVSTRGLRNVIDGETELLRNFEFNIKSPLPTTLHAGYTPAINRVTGAMTISLPAFKAAEHVSSPEGATHFRILTAAAEVDFERGTAVTDAKNTEILPLTGPELAAQVLSTALTPNSTHPLFLLLGIEFYQQTNNELLPLHNGAFSAMQIVEVLGV